MEPEKNMEKYEAYRSMMTNLTKAMRASFYYEAIFIEYAIIEDRCSSALKHAGVKYLNDKGHEIKLSEKLDKMRSNRAFVVPYVRKRITLEFLEQITNWKRERDRLIHALARIPYEPELVKSIAEDGRELVRVLDNKVKSVNNYYKNLAEDAKNRIIEYNH